MTIRQKELNRFQEKIRKRLTSDSATLNLDPRIEEEPEDEIIAWSISNKRDILVRVLDDLILDYFRNTDLYPFEECQTFLIRALRVCDFLQHERLKPTLKLILLCDDRSVWGQALDELRTLAARSLMGLSKTSNDLRFWEDVAIQCYPALPYALRAVLEIDLSKGCEIFWRMYFRPGLRGDNTYVDWPTVFDAANEFYGDVDIVVSAMEKAFQLVTKSKNLLEYDRIILRELRIPQYSKLGKRRITEVDLHYDLQIDSTPMASEKGEEESFYKRLGLPFVQKSQAHGAQIGIAPTFSQYPSNPKIPLFPLYQQSSDQIN